MMRVPKKNYQAGENYRNKFFLLVADFAESTARKKKTKFYHDIRFSSVDFFMIFFLVVAIRQIGFPRI